MAAPEVGHTWAMTAIDGQRVEVRPLSPIIGAEIAGLDLSRPLGDDAVHQVRDALNTHHVVFFRDQELSPTPSRPTSPPVRRARPRGTR